MPSIPPIPRRTISPARRARLFAESGGVCQRKECGRPIQSDTFHVAHLRSHANGGPETDSNLAAWCKRCNYEQGADDAGDPRVKPRQWQLEALDPIVQKIAADRAATVSAAPGAGKTVFAGLVFKALFEEGVVDRMVVLVPGRTLIHQWADALLESLHIQLKTDYPVERQGQHGVVLTYAALLNPDTLRTLVVMAQRSRTLVVLDEVHHVGEPVDGGPQLAWARALTEFAGTVDVDLSVQGVLNLSGTLWRSKQSERISTVRYQTLPDGKLQSLVDYEIPSEHLILAGELRPIDLFRRGLRVSMSDWTKVTPVESNIADLDEDSSRFAISNLAQSEEFRRSFVDSVLERLRQAHQSLDNYHAKALIVAARQDDARMFHAEVNRQMVERGLAPFASLAISDEDDATLVLEQFKKAKKAGVLCTVGMAGEGYDCPDIAVVGYATNKLTTLYVRQVVARAMRVTDYERQRGMPIPAAIVVPDVSELVEKLVSYLKPFLHEVIQPEGGGRPDFSGERPVTQPLLIPRFQMDRITIADDYVTVPHTDGTRYDLQGPDVRRFEEQLVGLQIPPVFAARILVAVHREVAEQRDAKPFDPLTPEVAALDAFAAPVRAVAAAPRKSHVEREALDSIEAQCKSVQKLLRGLEGWWKVNGNSQIGAFISDANHVGGMQNGGRQHADLSQLQRAHAYETRVISEYCAQTGKQPPRGLRRL